MKQNFTVRQGADGVEAFLSVAQHFAIKIAVETDSKRTRRRARG